MGQDKYGLNWQVTARDGASDKKQSSSWHDINDPGTAQGKPAEKAQTQPVEDATPAEPPKKKEDPEVELLSADKWEPGPEGFQFNKKCFLTVTGKYLKKTIRKRILADLFVRFENEDEDLHKELTTYLENEGTAKFEVPLYIGEKYHRAARTDSNLKCHYLLKNIRHSLGVNRLESALLKMPVDKPAIKVDFIRIPSEHFHRNCALPCLTDTSDLISLLAGAFTFSQASPDREMIVQGHADQSGNAGPNLTISKRRAEAIKALLSNDSNLWSSVVQSNGTDQRIETEDYQQTLKTLSTKHGWPCDPGRVDNMRGPKTEAAVRSFQTEYNRRFPSNEQLVVDGAVGPRTWLAVFHTMRHMLERALASPTPDSSRALRYGYSEGNGIYPCGERCPTMGRCVELVFYRRNDWSPAVSPESGPPPIDVDTDPVSRKKWEKSLFEKTADEEVGHLSLLLKSNSGAVPLANVPYTVVIEGGPTLSGRTDSAGFLYQDRVPIGMHQLRIENGVSIRIPALPVRIERLPFRIAGLTLFR